LEKIGKIDVLIHSAGLAHQFGDTKKEEFDSVNVEGTRNIVNLSLNLQVKHFILISSTAVYGIKSLNVNVEETDDSKAFEAIDEYAQTNPQTLYAQSKLEAETVCREVCEKNNLPLTIFRLAPVIGEANVGNVARLISSIDKGRFLWIGKGENLKSLIYKNDVARACVALLKREAGETEIYNLSAPPVKMKDFVNEIAGRLDKKIYGFSIPEKFIRNVFRINSKFIGNKKLDKIKDTIEKWLSDDVYSAGKINEKYGFVPKTSISKAIDKQIEWYKKVKK
jgi:nucleoside-diphosphate-sugar epimerase